MLKLATPIQYEPSLEGLNVLRPLQLADEVKTELALPVLCVNPIDKTHPATGKLARCSEMGSLLKSKSVFYDEYEKIPLTFYNGYENQTLTFKQKVFQVFAHTEFYNFTASTWWCDPSYYRMYAPIDYNLDVMLPFVGQTMYFSSNAGNDDVHGIVFYGFF